MVDLDVFNNIFMQNFLELTIAAHPDTCIRFESNALLPKHLIEQQDSQALDIY